MTRRRELIIAIAAGLTLWPLAPFAQQRPVKSARIGYLVPAESDRYENQLKSFRSGLRDLGYIEGKNLVLEIRNAQGNYDRLAQLAAELVRLKVDVIVTRGTDAARAAQKATATIPIVMLAVADPVGSGLVKSLGRPGGNITGFSGLLSELITKHVELLQDLMPKLARVAVLVNPDNTSHLLILRNAEEAAGKIGVKLLRAEVKTAQDLERAFATLAEQNAQAIIVVGDAFFNRAARQIAELALKHRLPSVGRYIEEGLLMRYAQIAGPQSQRAAIFIDKILKGTKPADLPVEQPMRFELVINMKTAKTLGITFPPEIMVRVDRVIE